jgi:peroxiredoxin
MHRRIFIASLIIAVAIPFSFASEHAGSHSKKAAYKLGDTVAPFSLKDVDGKNHDLNKVLGKKIIVLDFLNCQCPISNITGFEEQRKSIVEKYKGKDVVYLGIDSNQPNSESLIKDYAKKNKLNYKILKDVDSKIADHFGAQRTPEIFVIGKDKKIKYHGTIADNKSASKAEKHYLVNALDALNSGKEVAVQQSKAFGCAIKRAK